MSKLLSQMPQMSRRHILGSAGLLGLFAAMPGYARAMASGDFGLIRKQVEDYVATKKVAGMLVSLGFGAQPAALIGAGNLALDVPTPVDANSLWRVYSMTKPITGMAAMMLIEQGKLKLDQPIADFIPEFANMKVLTDPAKSLDAVPAKTLITPRHLMTHTAGLGYNIITKGPLLEEYNKLGINPAAVSKTPIPGFPMPAPTPSIDEFARRVASLPLIAEPGTVWSYSIGLDLLGYVIQVASGMEFGAFLKKNMFDPLGMTSSYFTVPQSEVARLSTNYAPFAGALIPIDPAQDSIFTVPPAFPFGGAGLVSSAADYDRFLAMLVGKGQVNGTRIMSEATALMGMSNLLPPGVETKGTMADGSGFGAGGRVGIGTDTSPIGTYGWGGAAGTVAFVDHVRGIRASGYTQYMPSDTYPFQREFPKMVYEQLKAMG
ncbi:MAG: beta-lactamase family protein [Blastomonas sp.]|uniref:serine hydrolase domain-containing protein n=1 Tax=unclassified Blastomonas TaxID=2626550 RepID=UPI00082E27B4|nr:beta-lactamase family protein [Blastomonas sp.]MCH2237257.1 beta-lactamase family protein [Blastomonas sp.]OHD01707.1 MAG: serine hydrolase [Sphingopyxis sp. RIFCSPHIGHO2_01_FULL_65_24]